jgi:hypothetical protein
MSNTANFWYTCGKRFILHRKETRMAQIEWLTSMDEALREAKRSGKMILLDFFNPN